MKKFLYVLFLVLLIPSLAFGQPPVPEVTYVIEPPTFELSEPMEANAETIPDNAFIIPLRAGQRVREDGIFYSLEANAWLLSEFNRIQVYWISTMDHRLRLYQEWADSELEARDTRHEAEIQILEVEIEAERRRINALQDMNDAMRRNVGWSRREKFRFAISIIGVAAVVGLGGYIIGGITAN